MGETHNLWITVDLCGNLGMADIPRVAKFSWRHFELRFDALEGEVVQLLIEFLKKLCKGIEAIKLPKLYLEPSEK